MSRVSCTIANSECGMVCWQFGWHRGGLPPAPTSLLSHFPLPGSSPFPLPACLPGCSIDDQHSASIFCGKFSGDGTVFATACQGEAASHRQKEEHRLARTETLVYVSMWYVGGRQTRRFGCTASTSCSSSCRQATPAAVPLSLALTPAPQLHAALVPTHRSDATTPPRGSQAEKERREEQAREGRRIPKGQTPVEPYKTIEARDVGWSIIDSDFSKDKVVMRMTRPQAVLLRTGLEPIEWRAYLWLVETTHVAAFVLSVSVCLPASASWRTRRGRGTCTWPASTRRPTSTR